MSGRGGRSGGRGGRGNRNRKRGQPRGNSYAGASNSSKKGLCAALNSNVFDYGQKNSADQMRTSWEKIVQYVGTTYGQDISNELQNKAIVALTEPVHTTVITARHAVRETIIRRGQERIQTARRASEAMLKIVIVKDPNDADARMKLAVLQNEIADGDFEAAEPVPVVLTDSEKMQHSNEWRTFREQNAKLIMHRGQTFSLILGQCTQMLQDKMKQDPDWTTTSMSYDPLVLIALIKKTTLAQTEDQYPFATMYDQESAFYTFQQDKLSNPQWYERFNTKVDVGAAIGVTHQHQALLKFTAQNEHTQAFAALGAAEQVTVRADAEERYIS